MKNISIAIIVSLGVALPYTASADEDDVTIRMMPMNETALENIMKDIELPESASDTGRENSAQGLANANERRRLNRERKAERDALKEERKAERDALKEEREAMKDDAEMNDDMADTKDMIKEDRLTGLDRANEVRSNISLPELPELPEQANIPELPEAAGNRAEQANR